MRDLTGDEAAPLKEAVMASERPERVKNWPPCPDCKEPPSLVRYGAEIPVDFKSDVQHIRVSYTPCQHTFRLTFSATELYDQGTA